MEGRPRFHRLILLLGAVVWLASLGQGPFVALHVLSQHRCVAEPAPALTHEEDGCCDDHGHALPDLAPCSPPAKKLLAGPVVVPPADLASSAACRGDYSRGVRLHPTGIAPTPHLSMSPVLRL
jgi:hypothetical protein